MTAGGRGTRVGPMTVYKFLGRAIIVKDNYMWFVKLQIGFFVTLLLVHWLCEFDLGTWTHYTVLGSYFLGLMLSTSMFLTDPGYLPSAKLFPSRSRSGANVSISGGSDASTTPGATNHSVAVRNSEESQGFKAVAREDCGKGPLASVAVTAEKKKLFEESKADHYHPLLGELDPATMCFCEECEQWVPRDTIHCAECEMCIVNHDHHCGVYGCCIGIRNIQFFLITEFLAVVSIWTCVFGLVFPSWARDCTKIQGGFWNKHNPPHLILLILGVLMLMMVIILFVFHSCYQFKQEANRSRHATSWMSAVKIAHKAWWLSSAPNAPSLVLLYVNKRKEFGHEVK